MRARRRRGLKGNIVVEGSEKGRERGKAPRCGLEKRANGGKKEKEARKRKRKKKSRGERKKKTPRFVLGGCPTLI